jgi:hypothetical protein
MTFLRESPHKILLPHAHRLALARGGPLAAKATTNMTANATNPQLDAAYLTAYNRLMTAMKAMEEKIHDAPAPESDGVTWGHVGDFEYLASKIEELVTGD